MKLLLLLLISSCASTEFSPTDTGEINHGEFPAHYKSKIQEYLNNNLKDPGSLVIKDMSKPEKNYVLVGVEKPHWYDQYSDVTFTKEYGWLVCSTYRGKNSYGAYNGWRKTRFFFNNQGSFIVPLETTKEMLSGMHRKKSVKGQHYSIKPCRDN